VSEGNETWERDVGCVRRAPGQLACQHESELWGCIKRQTFLGIIGFLDFVSRPEF
jgi:hypothetical protein